MSETSHESKAARDKPKHVACAVCMTEIPASVAVSDEGADYVRHFCGEPCFARWREQAQAEQDKPSSPNK